MKVSGRNANKETQLVSIFTRSLSIFFKRKKEVAQKEYNSSWDKNLTFIPWVFTRYLIVFITL